jgi:hypothetical protein
MTLLSEKAQFVKKLMRLNSIFIGLTHSALMRESLDMEGKVLLLPDALGGFKFQREIRFNYADPYELYLFDRLIIPKIKCVFKEAAHADASTLIQRPWTPQGLYAVHNGVSRHDFAQVSIILDQRNAEREALRQQNVIPFPSREPKYA